MQQKESILVIDDDETYLKLISEILKKRNHLVTVSKTGDNLDYLIENKQIQLLLLDIHLADFSGIDMLISVREKYHYLELPIIMITSSADEATIANCLHRGANDYISKPINLQILIARVETQLNVARLSREIAKKNEMATINSMIITYNHEINNPLAIAMGILNGCSEILSEDKLKKLSKQMERILEVTRKISNINNDEIEYDDYGDTNKMIRLNK